MFHDDSRALQDRFDTRRIADRIAEVLVHDRIDDHQAAFIAERDMFFLATADADGVPTCSYKGGDPGFVRVVDERTLAFPSYDGNGMYLSLGNVAANPEVGLLFIDLVGGNRLRVQGRAALHLDDPLMAEYDGAQLVVRVHVTQVFPTVRATSTATSRYGARRSCRGAGRSRPSRTGSAPTGRATTCPPATRRGSRRSDTDIGSRSVTPGSLLDYRYR